MISRSLPIVPVPALAGDMPFIASSLKRLMLDDRGLDYGQFLVVRDGERVLGFGRVINHGGFLELASIAVIEEDRSRGIGRALVESLMRRCPPGEIYLVTDIPAFFARFGFKETSEVPQAIRRKIVDFCQGKSAAPVVAMVKEV